MNIWGDVREPFEGLASVGWQTGNFRFATSRTKLSRFAKKGF